MRTVSLVAILGGCLPRAVFTQGGICQVGCLPGVFAEGGVYPGVCVCLGMSAWAQWMKSTYFCFFEEIRKFLLDFTMVAYGKKYF